VLRALIFDFDDILVESERINDALFAEHMARSYGIRLSRAELDYLYGLSWSGVFGWLTRHRGLDKTREEVWPGFVQTKRDYLAGHRLRVATGLERMLSLDLRRAIVSGSTRQEIDMMMDNAGLDPGRVDFILADEDVRLGKPDPQGYRIALDRMGVDAQEALVFEDSAAGIQAARGAGIPVAFVAELASRDAGQSADYRFATLADAYPWVRRRMGRTVLGAEAS
jgi:beta-phosphoglucomutase